MRSRWIAAAQAAALFALPSSIATAATASTTSLIYSVAGDGVPGYGGDSGAATDARLNLPRGLTTTADGGFLIAQASNAAVRRVSPRGVISTAAGTGRAGFDGDGGPAARAQLNFVHAVASAPSGSFLIADTFNQRIRRVGADRRILTVAGIGSAGYGGDGGPALDAALSGPHGVAATHDGGFLIADTENDRIRRVTAAGTITTVAGTGTRGFSGDGGPAAVAQLDRPFAIAVMADGGFLIADTGNQRVRRIDPTGRITTVAGTGTPGFSGDGARAVLARLRGPSGVAAIADGGFLITDETNNRIRRVTRFGVISTVTGGGRAEGDGGPAEKARLKQPKAVVATADGGMLIADAGYARVRYVAPARASWLAVALIRRAQRSRPGRPVRVRLVTSIAVTARVELLRGGRVLARLDAGTQAGVRRLVMLVAPRRAGVYSLHLSGRTKRGQVATDSATLTVAG
jgi:NHL repeat-containing protein